MRHSLLPLLLLFTIANSSAQDASKVAISNTGCTVEVYCFPGRFDVYDMEDESTVYANDCEKEGVMYGILANTAISKEDTATLQYKILQSHSVGVGDPIPVEVAKLMLITKVHAHTATI